MGNLLYICKCTNIRNIRSSKIDKKISSQLDNSTNWIDLPGQGTSIYSQLYCTNDSQFDTFIDSIFEHIDNKEEISTQSTHNYRNIDQEHKQILSDLKYL